MPTASQFREAARRARWARDQVDDGERRVRAARDDDGIRSNGGLAQRLNAGLSSRRDAASALGDRFDELARELDWRAAECDRYQALLAQAESQRASWLADERRAAAEQDRLPNEAAAPTVPPRPYDWIDL